MASHSRVALPLLLILIAAQASTGLNDGEGGSEISHDVDNFKDWMTWEPSEHVRQLYPMTRIGHDKNGSVVYVKDIGLWNLGGLGEDVKDKKEELWKYFEKLIRLQERDAKLYGGGKGNVLVYDFDGFHFNPSFTDEDREMLFKQLEFLEREGKATKKGFMINLGEAFHNFLDITGAGLVVDNYLASFERFDGPKTNEWRAKLLELVPADQLPVKYGGTKSKVVWIDN